jgi:ubiquinone biosynthesis protein COQ9
MANLGKCSTILRFHHLFKISNTRNLKFLSSQTLPVLPKQTSLQSNLINTPKSFFNTSSNVYDNKDAFRELEELKEKKYNEQGNKASECVNKEIDEEQNKVNELRNKILAASLEFVPAHGWTKLTISKGAESIGYPGVAHGMFSYGGIELVHYFYMDCNKKLVKIIKERLESSGETKTDPIGFAKETLKCRLSMLKPYLKTWPQAMALMGLPQNASKSLANLLTMVDDICYYSGDRSVDFGWYVRRVGLASIYKVTELYMLQDTSPDFIKTWEFLDRRIEDGVYIHNYIDNSGETTKNVQRSLTTAFETARNILGVNFDRR